MTAQGKEVPQPVDGLQTAASLDFAILKRGLLCNWKAVDPIQARILGEVWCIPSGFVPLGIAAGQVELGGDFVLAGKKHWRL